MKKLLVCFIFALSFCVKTKAQLTMTSNLSNADVQNLLTGFGVNISNLVINCHAQAIGEFSGVSTLPISHGLMLSTGGVHDFICNDSIFGGWSNIQITDPDTFLLSQYNMFDLAVLEFDCIPQGDTLLFNFIFGSSEYLTFVNSPYNDVFAIFMSGPGIAGMQNVARLPNGDIVCVNNVNPFNNASYYLDNPSGANGLCYNGFTQNLQVFAITTPGLTYHFKIMITDVSDAVLDSGVLLEAFSFRSPTTNTSSIKENNKSEIKLYPNPSDGSLIIRDFNFDGTSKAGSITDLSGRLIQAFTITQSQQLLDLYGIADGMYHITIKDDQTVTNIPLVIKK